MACMVWGESGDGVELDRWPDVSFSLAVLCFSFVSSKEASSGRYKLSDTQLDLLELPETQIALRSVRGPSTIRSQKRRKYRIILPLFL